MAILGASKDPYSTVTRARQVIPQPGIERYVPDRIMCQIASNKAGDRISTSQGTNAGKEVGLGLFFHPEDS
jgi:hypothetical protein